MFNPAYVLESILPRDIIKFELTKYNLSERQESINEITDNYYRRIEENSDIILYRIQEEYERQIQDDFFPLDQGDIYGIMLNYQRESIKLGERRETLDKSILLSLKTLNLIHAECQWWDVHWDNEFEILILGGHNINDILYKKDIINFFYNVSPNFRMDTMTWVSPLNG